MGQLEDNKRRTRSFVDAMSRGDAEAIADAYADDGQLCTMGGTAISGRYDRDQIRAFAGGVLEAFPGGLRFTIETMTAEEDRVAVVATSEGEHVSGKPYRNHYHFLFTWRDGKLQELREYMDTELVTEVICGGHRP
jgi:uncharacterized protein (TIGR02246 family)